MVAENAGSLTAPARGGVPERAMRWLAANREQARMGLRLVQLSSRLLPMRMFGRERAMLLRMAGVRIGPQTYIYGEIDLHGATMSCSRLVIGSRVVISPHSSIDLSAQVSIEDDVSMGHHVVIITADHEVGPLEHRCGPLAPRPVTIGRGSWIGARVTILPGITIGAASIVSAGSTVSRDVPPDTLVSGSPARAVRSLASSENGHRVPAIAGGR